MTDDLQHAIANAPVVETAQACVVEWPLVSIESLIETFMRKNVKGENLPFMGINKDKEIVPTAANTGNVDNTKYNVLCQGEFVFSGMQTGRDICIRIALSQLQTPVLLSPAYTTFKIKREAPVLAEYFFLNFKSQEMDRRGWFKSDSSVRSNLDWDRFCEIKIPLPPIEMQQQYVDAYQGLTGIIEQNEALVKSLEKTAQACVAECKSKWPLVSIETLIETFMRKNVKGENLPFMGINKDKEIVPTAANTGNVDKTKYNVLCQGEFVFSGMQTGRDICIRIALSQLQTPVLLSPAYTTFKIKKEAPVLAEYFFLNFKSKEMDRRGWFKSDSSVRSNLDWDRFCEIKIPLPPIEVQQAIVSLYHCAEEARKIANEAKKQLAQVCPAMIQRASHIR